MWRELTNYMDGFLDLGIPGFDCIVYFGGREVYRRCNGFRDAAHNVPVDGSGTVKVIIINSEKGVASEELINEVKTHIEENRPIGAEVTVESAALS